ncbi:MULTISPECIES: hypothetical protein [Ensifer]|uniref:Uncharacterized protein n=1 Tax=Ensifer canadensis TaxID=555315 RepID=A0AAW4FT41_9HYPH|nr:MULTISPECIES: hypothetical protein [Ensifer]MDP9630295.1 hypothetical protein [Ensifer adhaerens]KQU85759.1 hypothetical protein ASD00_31655 [Ensifer sp. Root31]KQW53921.1 hypothetical protein ASD02_31135 [Ensifer sp. Root1252]KQW83281.1 hypothetical protein ASD03_21530 [Ensifer sp. Root127]KQY68790.1 hypothetical protein ASD52_32860 [Ensifer sp. Root142]
MAITVEALASSAGFFNAVPSGMGWDGPPGRSSLWLSQGFIREYWDYQAEKFALIDQAHERLTGNFNAATAPAADERAQSVTSAGP